MKSAVVITLFVVVSWSAARGKAASPSFVVPKEVRAIRLTVTPMPAPVPALRYRLMPELRDLQTGNAVVLYYRSFTPEWQIHRNPAITKVFNKWSEDSRSIPPKDLDWVRSSSALKQLDLGARRSHVDWEMLEPLRREGLHMLLGDVQGFRTSSALLSARVRLECADGDFNKAIYTLQTGLKLARDIGDAPTLIQSLVGMTIAGNMFEQTDEFIRTAGSPNLYWALTDLPTPFVSLRKPYQGEKIWVDNFFPGLREILVDKNVPPMPEDQLRVIVANLSKNMEFLEGSTRPADWHTRMTLSLLAASAQPEARRFLLAQGRSKEVVDSMSSLQAFLLLEVHNYDRMYDDLMKWVNLPYPESSKGVEAAIKQVREARATGQVGTMIAALMLPAIQRVQLTSARTDRRIAAQRVVEALRLFAAGHSGKFPKALVDIHEVPIPLDPVTGQAFLYRLDDDRATLFAPAPPGHPDVSNALLYELTLRR